MARREFTCPKCKHRFWADEFKDVRCPKDGTLVQKAIGGNKYVDRFGKPVKSRKPGSWW